MTIELRTPDVHGLAAVVAALGDWQHDAAPLQLHPGDLGWSWRAGAGATAAAVRTWSQDGRLLAIGLLDGPGVVRLTVAPDVWRDEELAGRVVADVADPQRGVLPTGEVSVEAPTGSRVHDLLRGEVGWREGERWTPLRRDLTEPVPRPALGVEVVGPGEVAAFTAVHRSAWDSARFTEETWHAMAAGPAFADARCLLGRDEHGVAVAGVTVWSAGPGRPGLIEPMGVHAEHRGRGHGTAICVAAAAALAELGAASALVCTPTSLVSAVATYEAAGFRRLPERFDRTRDV
ncbi:GNAT family N-acetyltransferase [Jatrophihabitans endophyticus]|uniref:GNAT family N-acetyltransferase n=1 Tax=Jatrophihabitans endophyticus TaxID=1206085 RepID=UPI000933A9E5|nr:GNAT family N-acetyltransferase [Jatrophihabitans endophyticus]